MESPAAGPTLFLPRPVRGTTGSRHSPTELPEDLLNQSASRLRTLTLLYAFVFFMAGLALDRLILSCLEKDRALRPQSARELSRRLADIEGADEWTEELARDWWGRHWPMGGREVVSCDL